MPEGSNLDEFEALFVKHYPRIVGILRRIVGDHGRAEDVASEVFLKLYRASRAGFRCQRRRLALSNRDKPWHRRATRSDSQEQL